MMTIVINWLLAVKIHSPLCETYYNPSTQGVFVSSEIAHWTLPHEMGTPLW